MKKIIENIIYFLNLILGVILLVSLFIDLKEEFLKNTYIFYLILCMSLLLYNFIDKLLKNDIFKV